jgi:glyoxylase-like metal-dependent hydrolase (beta-lactamase superfamily II)
MRTIPAVATSILLTAVMSGCSRPAGVAAAAEAMGATGLNSIQYSGSGSTFAFGQAPSPGAAWPRFEAKTYHVAVDYQAPAMRLEIVRAQGEHPPLGGGGQPFAGDQRTVQVVSGMHAWTDGAQPTPNPGAVSERLRQLWLTPHGVIKAAVASGATAAGNVVTFPIEGREVTVTLNDENLVERVEYLMANSVVGDVPVEVTYSDYGDYGAFRFPRRIVEKQDGFDTLDITITEVMPNAAVSLPVPANVAQAAPAPAAPPVQIEMAAEGVWSVNGGNTRSLAVEFSDHIVMLEGPTSEARSMAVNEAVRKAVPAKPIRYVVNTHAHYDHAGGLRTYVAEGITVITHEGNKAFFEQAWARPRTIEPDALSRSPRAAMIDTVGDKRVLTDGSRTIELHHLKDSGHNTATLIAYLPKERILMYGDGYNPPPGDDPRTPDRSPEYAIQLYDNVQRLKLNPARIAPVHGRVVPFENMKIAIGVSSSPNVTR